MLRLERNENIRIPVDQTVGLYINQNKFIITLFDSGIN
jgi:hypothetical protein